MSTSQYSISWNSYKSCISKGFSSLQQNGEFVDMTLAAEGHLVKVHQNIVALASPYLKAMIQSASCQHPVVFLNNISHETLGYLLEYIYTGEVKIPVDVISVFIEACKSLYVRGAENFHIPKKTTVQDIPKEPEQIIERSAVPSDHDYTAHITINSDNNYNLEVQQNDNINITKNVTCPVMTNNFQTSNDTSILANDYAMENLQVQPLPVITIENKQMEPQQMDNITQNVTYPVLTVDNFNINYDPSTCATIDNATKKHNLKDQPLPVILIENKQMVPQQMDNITQNVTYPIVTVDNFNINYDPSTCANIDNATEKDNLKDQPLPVTSIENKQMDLQQNENYILPNFNINYKPAIGATDDNASDNLQAQPLPIITIGNKQIELQQFDNNIIQNTTCPIMNIDNLKINYDPSICATDDNATDNLQAHPPSVITIENKQMDSQQIDNNIMQNVPYPLLTVDNFNINYDSSMCATINNTTEKDNLQAQSLPIISIQNKELGFQQSYSVVDTEVKNKSNMLVSNTSGMNHDQRNVIVLSVEEVKPATPTIRTVTKNLQSKADRDKLLHYTYSSRGSLQIILNRYMYNCHHQSCGGRLRRWRCIDYRKLNCRGLLDTDNGVISNRLEEHCHPYHDTRVLNKFKTKTVFTSLQEAEDIASTFKEKSPDNKPTPVKRRKLMYKRKS